MPALFTDAFFDELVKRLNNDPDFKTKAGGVVATVLMVNTDSKESLLLNLNKGAAAWSKGNMESKADFTFLGRTFMYAVAYTPVVTTAARTTNSAKRLIRGRTSRSALSTPAVTASAGIRARSCI